MDEITLDDHTYISSKRASELTGYTKDYVGQLCREGRVEAKQIGRNWYVLETSIKAHRFGTEAEQTTARVAASAASGVDAFESPWKAPTYEAVISSPLPALTEKPEKPSVNELDRSSSLQDSEISVVHQDEYSFTPLPPEPVLARAPVSSEVISQMESAWKDWFKARNDYGGPDIRNETLLESPEIIDARENEAGFEESEVQVAVHRTYEGNEYTPSQQEMQKQQTQKNVAPEPEPRLQRESATRNAFEMQPNRARATTMAVPSNGTSFGKGSRAEAKRKFRNEAQYEGRIISERRVYPQQKPSIVLKVIFISLAIIAAAIAVIGTGKANQFISDNESRLGAIEYLNGQSVVNNN